MKSACPIVAVAVVGWVIAMVPAANAQALSQSPRYDTAAPPLAMELVGAPAGS